MKRQIIRINEDKCDGCALCVKGCPEGAIQLIDGKARLVSAVYCDGLGACIGECPHGAITIEEVEAAAYDEVKTLANILPQGRNTVLAHLKHLKEHGQKQYLSQALEHLKSKGLSFSENELGRVASHSGCPGSRVIDLRAGTQDEPPLGSAGTSHLRHWPIQLHLLNPGAPFFDEADLLVAADCVPFANADFHRRFLRGKVLIILCPKLDDSKEEYLAKLAEIFSSHDIRSVTVAHMEVPCCFGTMALVQEALTRSGKTIPVQKFVVSLQGLIK